MFSTTSFRLLFYSNFLCYFFGSFDDGRNSRVCKFIMIFRERNRKRNRKDEQDKKKTKQSCAVKLKGIVNLCII